MSQEPTEKDIKKAKTIVDKSSSWPVSAPLLIKEISSALAAEREGLEKELKESEARFDKVLDYADSGLQEEVYELKESLRREREKSEKMELALEKLSAPSTFVGPIPKETYLEIISNLHQIAKDALESYASEQREEAKS